MNKLAAILAGTALIAGPAFSQPPAADAGKPEAPASETGDNEQAPKPPATGAAPGAGAPTEPAAPKPEAPQGAEQGSEATAPKPQAK